MSNKNKVVEINVTEHYLNIGNRKLFPITENGLKEVFPESVKLEMLKEADKAEYILKCIGLGFAEDLSLKQCKAIEFKLHYNSARNNVTLFLCQDQCKEFGITYGFNKEYYFKTV